MKDVTVFVKDSEGVERIMRALAAAVQKENRRRKAHGGAAATYQISVVSDRGSILSSISSSEIYRLLNLNFPDDAEMEISFSHRDMGSSDPRGV